MHSHALVAGPPSPPNAQYPGAPAAIDMIPPLTIRKTWLYVSATIMLFALSTATPHEPDSDALGTTAWVVPSDASITLTVLEVQSM